MTLASQQPKSPRRGLPRLRAWYSKMLYLVVAFAVWYFSGALPIGNLGVGLLRSALAFALILLATRLFRAADEPDDRREWWRATGKPTAGFVLGSIFALCVIALVLDAYGYETMPKFRLYAGEDLFEVFTAIVAAALSVFYFTSSVRLRGILREQRLKAERKPGSK